MPIDRQLDLFDVFGQPAPQAAPPLPRLSDVTAAVLDDAALIAAIPNSSLAMCESIAAEVGRRRLNAAVPALEALCRRLKDLGRQIPAREQIAALTALAALGGSEAAAAVERRICRHVVQGPGFATAVTAAATLGRKLPADPAAQLLQHEDPRIRADAAFCAPSHPVTIALLMELLHDLNAPAATAAARALAAMRRPEARPALLRLLDRDPSPEVIDAIVPSRTSAASLCSAASPGAGSRSSSTPSPPWTTSIPTGPR